MTGTIFSTRAKGVRYLELTEGYITKLALDENTKSSATSSSSWAR